MCLLGRPARTARRWSVCDIDVGGEVGPGRLGRGLGLGDGLVDEPVDLVVDLVELVVGELAGLGHPAPEALEAVQRLARPGYLVGPVLLLIALEVAEVAGELDLDQGRAAALAGPGGRPARRPLTRRRKESNPPPPPPT